MTWYLGRSYGHGPESYRTNPDYQPQEWFYHRQSGEDRYVCMYVLQSWTIHKSRGDYSPESGPGKNRHAGTINSHNTHDSAITHM